jgi:hypothetical protein
MGTTVAVAALVLATAGRPAGALTYGANCLTRLTQWSQEPDADGQHERVASPIPIDGATLLWCRAETDVTIEVVPIPLEDGRIWYRLRALLPGPMSTGDTGLLDEMELGQ